MPEVEVSIGGRFFEVACQKGEEDYLQAAAKLLDTEAKALTEQMGRLSESRLLLMAGLLLADKTAGLEDHVRGLEEKLRAQEVLIAELRETTPGAPDTATLDALAERGEALADLLERMLPAAE